MTRHGPPQAGGPGGPGSGGKPGGDGNRDGSQNASWAIFSYLLAGMLVYGGIGWLISRWTHHPLIFPIGMLAGLGLSTWAVIYRFGRS
jgi:F0F1-type ATP synthase assembly protein I